MRLNLKIYITIFEIEGNQKSILSAKSIDWRGVLTTKNRNILKVKEEIKGLGSKCALSLGVLFFDIELLPHNDGIQEEKLYNHFAEEKKEKENKLRIFHE